MDQVATFFFVALLAAASVPADAAPRSAAAKDAFQRSARCPATGKPRGSCPGYVIDHVQPLCAGGQDRPSNMQWQTIADGKAKDRIERRQCTRATKRRIRALDRVALPTSSTEPG